MDAEVIDRGALEQALLAAHAEADGTRLAQLYERAADASEVEDDVRATTFYLTHALVFSLQEGLERAEQLRRRLAAYGCEDA